MSIFSRMRGAAALLLTVITLSLFSLSAFAQHEAINDDGTIDYNKVPEHTLREARMINEQCSRNTTRKLFYDCDCVSLRYLEERLIQGEVAPRTSIELQLENECRDYTVAAGDAYNECLKGHTNMKPGTDPEKMCECYANTYIRLLELKQPRLTFKNLSPLKIRANLTCSDPALAGRLYGATDF